MTGEAVRRSANAPRPLLSGPVFSYKFNATIYRRLRKPTIYRNLYENTGLEPYSRTSYDISQASDWSRWPSRPIRSLRYIVTCTRILAWKGPIHRYNNYNDSERQCPWKLFQDVWHYVRCKMAVLLLAFTSCISQQTRDIHPRLVQCWTSVIDGEPTLNQPWVNVSCLLRSDIIYRIIQIILLYCIVQYLCQWHDYDIIHVNCRA